MGLTLGVAGMIGLWGIGFFTPELLDRALVEVETEKLAATKSLTTALQDVGAFFGMHPEVDESTYKLRKQLLENALAKKCSNKNKNHCSDYVHYLIFN